jgi:hypothetical protein
MKILFHCPQVNQSNAGFADPTVIQSVPIRLTTRLSQSPIADKKSRENICPDCCPPCAEKLDKKVCQRWKDNVRSERKSRVRENKGDGQKSENAQPEGWSSRKDRIRIESSE